MKTISKRLLVLKKLKTKEKKNGSSFALTYLQLKQERPPKHVEVKDDSMVRAFPVTRVTRKNARGKR